MSTHLIEDLATIEALIARQTELIETLFIQRTDSPTAKAFWELQVGTLDDLVAFKQSGQRRAARLTQEVTVVAEAVHQFGDADVPDRIDTVEATYGVQVTQLDNSAHQYRYQFSGPAANVRTAIAAYWGPEAADEYMAAR